MIIRWSTILHFVQSYTKSKKVPFREKITLLLMILYLPFPDLIPGHFIDDLIVFILLIGYMFLCTIRYLPIYLSERIFPDGRNVQAKPSDR